MTPRPLPWTELIEGIGEERFAQIKERLTADKIDDLGRDAFLLSAPVGQLLRDMMPDEAPSDAVNAYGALIQMLYACWARDWPLVPVSTDQLKAAILRPTPYAPRPVSAVCYLQLPERLVWAEPSPGEPHEPLDGIFLIAGGGEAHALAVLGFRPGRDGFTTMEGAIALPAPAPAPRDDGSAPYSSRLPAGERAQLLSVLDAHELVALALSGLETAESRG